MKVVPRLHITVSVHLSASVRADGVAERIRSLVRHRDYPVASPIAAK